MLLEGRRAAVGLKVAVGDHAARAFLDHLDWRRRRQHERRGQGSLVRFRPPGHLARQSQQPAAVVITRKSHGPAAHAHELEQETRLRAHIRRLISGGLENELLDLIPGDRSGPPQRAEPPD